MIRNIRVAFLFLFFHFCVILFAQETDFYKSMLRESLKTDIYSDVMNYSFPDTLSYKKEAMSAINKHIFFNTTSNHSLDFLFPNDNNRFPTEKKLKISPYLTMPYTNQQNYNSKATEITSKAISNVGNRLPGATITINPIALVIFLMQTGILPDEPSVPTVDKRKKKLKTITQDVYHIDDDY